MVVFYLIFIPYINTFRTLNCSVIKRIPVYSPKLFS